MKKLWFMVPLNVDCHASYDERKDKTNHDHWIKNHRPEDSFPSYPQVREKIPRDDVEYGRHLPQKLNSEFNLLLAKQLNIANTNL